MVHSDLLNSLTNTEKVILLGCVLHATGKDYQYEDIIFFKKRYIKELLERYYNVVNEKQKSDYEKMVDKINKAFKLL